MSDFTPGPWSVKHHAFGTPEVYEGDGSPYKRPIATVLYWLGSEDAPIVEANARLIAKSPDMYGALKSLMKKTDCNDYNYLEVYSINNLLAEIDGEEIPFPDLTEKPPWHKT